MFAGRPIIGVAGGIGSGKSFVARLFGELGCLVIDSDEQVRAAYRTQAVRDALRQWWGERVFRPDGSVDRQAVAAIVFADDAERQRLEALTHPIVNSSRDKMMRDAIAATEASEGGSGGPVAFVWDVPLLFETGLNRRCDRVVFVDAPPAVRLSRVQQTRGWSREELDRREKSQWPLDKKRSISHDIVSNVGEPEVVREQVRDVLRRTISELQSTS
jgi:dephospho-CoA kinase